MAGELQAVGTSGTTVYVVVLSAAGQFANGVSLEAFNGANWTSYAVATLEQGTSSIFLGDMPALPAGAYAAVAYRQAGGGPAQSDPAVGAQSRIDWSGTAVVPLPAVTGGGVTLADGVAHGGTPGSSTATLALTQVTVKRNDNLNAAVLVENDGGHALQLMCSGGACMSIQAVANADGINIGVGSNGYGIKVVGADNEAVYLATSFDVNPSVNVVTIDASGGQGHALKVAGDTLDAVLVQAFGNNSAVKLLGAGTAPAVAVGDGTAGAEAMKLLAGTGNTNADAVVLTGAGSGAALHLTSADTALHLESANLGINVQATSNALILNSTGDVGVLIGGAAGGVSITTGSGSPALKIEAGVSAGVAVQIIGHFGDAVAIFTDAGHAIALRPTDGNGIDITPSLSGSSAAVGINVVGAGTGPGVFVQGGATDADGVSAVGTGTGAGFRSVPDAVGFGGGGGDPWATDISTGYTGTQAGAILFGVTAGVVVTTNNDKTGYSLTQAFPANFAALGITAGGAISEVVLCDTTTTNTDMRGTDSAALAATALSTATWTGALATALGTLASHDPGTTLGTSTLTAAQVLTTALAESYAAVGVAPTLSQAVFEVISLLSNRAVVGTTLTNYKLDGTTAAMTFTINSAGHPTTQTRAT